MSNALESVANVTAGLRRLYNDHRTALFNREYYGCRLEHTRRWNLGLEVVIAIGTSSAVSGWLIWKDSTGETVWAIITGITAILAIVKPFLDLPKQIERYSKLFIGHGEVFYDLDQVVADVRTEQGFTSKLKRKYNEALVRNKELAADDDPKTKQRLGRKCQASVNKQLPAKDYWLPTSEEQ